LTERRAAGLELLRAKARIDGFIADCTAALAALGSVEEGEAPVGVVSTARYFAPFALAAFRRGHPEIDLKLTIGNRAATIEALREIALDFAIMGRPPDRLPVEAENIGDHPHLIIAPPGHPLAAAPGGGLLPLKALTGDVFLMREAGSGTRALSEKLFAQAGFQPRIGMEIHRNETIKQAVMAGLGIAFISAHTVAAELRRPARGHPRHRGPAGHAPMVGREACRKTPSAGGQALWRFLADQGAAYLPLLAAAA
jgi:LysR family transcriptional regulator for metE and metH